MNLDAI